jgi:drug/metabolite transporter (DMT)-like permease
VLIRRGNKTDPPVRIIFYFTLASTIGSGMLLLLGGWTSPSPSEWLGLAVITISSLLGQLFLTYSLQKAPVWVVSPFGYLTPVLGVLLGYFLWQEKMTTANLIGCSIIVFCGCLMLRSFKKIK